MVRTKKSIRLVAYYIKHLTDRRDNRLARFYPRTKVSRTLNNRKSSSPDFKGDADGESSGSVSLSQGHLGLRGHGSIGAITTDRSVQSIRVSDPAYTKCPTKTTAGFNQTAERISRGNVAAVSAVATVTTIARRR